MLPLDHRETAKFFVVFEDESNRFKHRHESFNAYRSLQTALLWCLINHVSLVTDIIVCDEIGVLGDTRRLLPAFQVDCCPLRQSVR